MSFWDNYEDLGEGGSFISAPEKKVLMDNGIPLKVTAAFQDDDPKYGLRYVLKVQVPNPETGDEEDRKVTFPINSGVESRDRMLAQMVEYLAGDDSEPVGIKLETVGRAILIRQA